MRKKNSIVKFTIGLDIVLLNYVDNTPQCHTLPVFIFTKYSLQYRFSGDTGVDARVEC